MSTLVNDSTRGAPVQAPPPGWMERWGDRLNPLVVKEVRQGLRSRVFWVCFGLMLLACFMVSLSAFVSSRDNGMTPQGQGFFFSFFFCLGVVHYFIIPYSAYRSLAREREDETWVLLVLTGLGPRKILRGKVASYLVQAGLYASAVGPFLLFSYYLNGIDLPTILVVLGLGAAWLVFLTVVAVCAATLADGRMGRALVHFLLLGTLGMSFIYTLMAAFFFSEQGYRFATRDDDLLLFVGTSLWLMLSNAWLLFETAAARLSLTTENYARGPRLALVVQTALTALFALGIYVKLGFTSPGAFVALSVGGGVHLAITGLFVATDQDGQARTLRAGTRPWSLLRPGALRGFRLAVLLQLAWGAVCCALFAHLNASPGSPHDTNLSAVMFAPALYAIIYLSLPLLVGRLPRSERLASPAVIRVLFFVFVGLAGSVPPLLALLGDLAADDMLVNLLNPFIGLGKLVTLQLSEDAGGGELGMLACVAVVALLLAYATDRALAERERRAHAG